MDENVRLIKNDEEIKIFSDPYRMKIISVYQKYKKAMTVKEVADIMGEVPAKVHYHVQKLLSIDILTLDHVEVINGINAKYYRLVTSSFNVAYQKDDGINFSPNVLSKIQQTIIGIVDEFKSEIHDLTDYCSSQPGYKENQDLSISKDDIYLSESDFLELKRELKELFERYNTPDEKKKEYSFFTGIVKRKPVK